MSSLTYTVSGMTCGHCAGAVTDELSAMGGVTDVAVDIDSGTVTVASDAPLADDRVAAAVAEAGYRVTGRA